MEKAAQAEKVLKECEVEKMTVQKKRTIGVDDIRAFEIMCRNCRSTLSIPIDKCSKTACQCPRCSELLYAGGAAENDAIMMLARAIREIHSESKEKGQKFIFRIEITPDDSPASPGPDADSLS
jgi:hypothetical protein